MTDQQPSPTEQAQHAALREALAGLLAPAGAEPQPQDFADVLWIARLTGLAPLPPTGPAAVPGPSDARLQASDRPADEAAEAAAPEPEPPGRRGEAEAPKVELHSHRTPEATGTSAARSSQVVQVTRPAALRGAAGIARALRPLRRPLRRPDHGTRPAGLDEEATAAATADMGVLVPVWRPERQPRFSVDLLVDTGTTMAVWNGLAAELATLLERHGAFADVRCWALDTDRTVPRLTPFRRVRPAGAPSVSGPSAGPWSRPLADPLGRRILLVLTDGVGPAWYGEELPAFLARAAGGRPVAALQVLPRRLWHRTALRPAPVEGRPAGHGRTAPVYRSDAALPGIARGAAGAGARAALRWLPLMEVAADWLAPWAELAAGRATGWTPMLAAPLCGVPRPERAGRTAAVPPGAAERVAAFRAGSSPDAYRLACHLAAAPLSLPVMRLVQRATVPGSGQTDLAELFLSGLLEVREKARDPDEVVYDFVDGVREELLAELTRSESVRVLEHVLARVSGRVAATFGGTLDFRALAASAGTGGRPLSPRSRPFAEVAVAVLAGAGGQHAALARELSTTVSGGGGAAVVPGPAVQPWINRDLLTPAPPIGGPSGALRRMIGRWRELDLLADVCDPDITHVVPAQPTTVVVKAEPGLGKRRLLQEYIRRHGTRHSLVHWIDGRKPGSLEAGIDRLFRALVPPDGAARADLPDLLAAHPGWLVVIDRHRPAPGQVPRAFVPPDLFGLTGAGLGSVVLTTPSREGVELPDDAVVITLGPFSDAELIEEIREECGEAVFADIHDTAGLRSLLERMPRYPDGLAGFHLGAEIAEVLARVAAADLPVGREVSRQLSTVARFRLPCAAVAIAAVPSPRGPKLLAVYGEDGLVHFIDAGNGRQAREPVALTVTYDVVALAAMTDRDGRTVLATASSDGLVDVWDLSGSLLHSRVLPTPPVAMAGYNVNGTPHHLWTVDRNGGMNLWQPDTDGLLEAEVGFAATWPMTAAPHAAGGSVLLGLNRSGSVRRWRFGDSAEFGFATSDGIHPGAALTIVGITSSEGRCVLASIGNQDDHVRIWRLVARPDMHSPIPGADQDTNRIVGGQYRLVEPFARGGAGELWRAEPLEGGRPVAVKLILRNEPELPEDFDRYVRVLQQVRHPGLVELYGAGVVDDTHYLVMELIDGPDLRRALDEGQVGMPRIAAIGRAVADALDHLHRHGIVHGDIKPANILIRPNGEAVVCDIGFAWLGATDGDDELETSRFWERGHAPATARYMSPEQARGERPGPLADLYSLGCVLYELATGQPPFTERSADLLARAHRSTVPVPPDRGRQDLPGDLSALIMQLLEKSPQRRPSDAAEVSRRLGLLEAVRPVMRGSGERVGYSVLGEVAVRGDDDPLFVPAPRLAAILVALLGSHGAPLTEEDLIEAVWDRGGSRPDVPDVLHVRAEIQHVVEQLHHAGGALVRNDDGGYVLHVDPEDVDAERFGRSVARAEEAFARDDLDGALRHANDALGMWQGPPLAGVPGPFAERERARLSRLHERVQELRDRITSDDAPEPDLRFSVLGPVRARRDGTRLDLGSPHQRAVLAALLLNAGQPLPTEALIQALWDDRPPPEAAAVLDTYVSGLRAILEDGTGRSRVLEAVQGGYRLRVPAGAVDLSNFTMLMAEAADMRAVGVLHEALRLLRTALSLWTGTPLAGLSGAYAAEQRAELSERRVGAFEEMTAVALQLGAPEQVVEELAELSATRPGHGRLRALLMLTLYRCGRREDALNAYRSVWKVLLEEFDREPAPMLTALYKRIVADDPVLTVRGDVDQLLDRLQSGTR